MIMLLCLLLSFDYSLAQNRSQQLNFLPNLCLISALGAETVEQFGLQEDQSQ